MITAQIEVIFYPQVDGITPSVISVCTDESYPELKADNLFIEVQDRG